MSNDDNLTLVSEVDFLSWIYDYILFVTSIDGSRVFRGNQSREVLPSDNEYCIYTPILRKRRGTNVYSFDAEDCDDDTNGTETFTGSVEMEIQVDFYGSTAARFAQGMETAARSELANRYFVRENVPLRVLYCTEPRDLTGLDASMQYVPRWTISIMVQFDSAVAYNCPWFEEVYFRRRVTVIPPGGGEPETVYKYGLANVDVEFPPGNDNDEN